MHQSLKGVSKDSLKFKCSVVGYMNNFIDNSTSRLRLSVNFKRKSVPSGLYISSILTSRNSWALFTSKLTCSRLLANSTAAFISRNLQYLVRFPQTASRLKLWLTKMRTAIVVVLSKYVKTKSFEKVCFNKFSLILITSPVEHRFLNVQITIQLNRLKNCQHIQAIRTKIRSLQRDFVKQNCRLYSSWNFKIF